jgi:exonuclease VII small subunit
MSLMKNENIPADIKSKSLKEAKDEINQILEKLEKNDADLEASKIDYERLVKLNYHVDQIFKKKGKEINSSVKKNND